MLRFLCLAASQPKIPSSSLNRRKLFWEGEIYDRKTLNGESTTFSLLF